MSLDVGELVGHLTIDKNQWNRGLSDGHTQLVAFGQRVKNLARQIGTAAALALGGALLSQIPSMISGASDLAETQSKVGVIFKDSADEIRAFAKTAQDGLGQSEQSALDAAATFAIFGKGAGLTGKKLVTFSTGLATLASDMASFSNTSPQEAIEAIGAALRGESDPIEKYGVLLNEAVIQQEGVRIGIIKTTKTALTPQQRVLAAQSAIYRQTKEAQGDFARTSGGLANQQRILSARFENTKAELGAGLLPAMLRIVETLSKMVGYVKANHTWLVPLAAAIGTAAGAIWLIVAAARAWAAIQAALNIVLSANPIGLIILAIAALVAGFILLYKNSATFRKIVDGAFAGIKKVVSAVVGWIVGTAWPWLQKAWKGIAAGAMWLWRNVISPVAAGIATQIRIISAVVMWLWRNVISPAARGIGAWFGFVMQIVRSVAALFIWAGRQIIGPVIGFVVGYIKWLGSIAMWLYNNALLPAWNGIVAATRFVGSVFSWLYNNIISPVVSGIGAAVTWVWTKVISPVFAAIMGIVHKVGSTFKSVFSAIGGFVTGAFGKAVAIAKGAINGLIDLLNKAIGFINSKLVDGLNNVPGVDFPHIPTLPKLAKGGAVHPTTGGRPVIMGDGGQVEYGLPRSDLANLLRQAAASGGGSNTLTVIFRGDGILRGVRGEARVGGGNPDVVLVGG